jgi:putative heme-binding domain-containing protein
MVLKRIAASDAELRRTALKILQKHAAWASQAVSVSQDWLGEPTLSSERKLGLRSLIAAFKSEPLMQGAIGNALQTAGNQSRRFLLEAIAQTGIASPAISKAIVAAAGKDEPPAIRLQAVRTIAALQISGAEQTLSTIAEAAEESSELRLEALRAAVGRRPKLTATGFDFLLDRLAGTNDPISRLAATEILRQSHLNDAQFLRALKAIRGQSLISPSALLPAWHETTGNAGELLDCFNEFIRDGWRPNEEEVGRFVQRFAGELQEKVKALFSSVTQDAAAQRAKLSQFEPLLNGGDAERGRATFFGNKVACGTCHAIGQSGGKIGPDLTKIGAVRSGRDLLESILLPSATFAQGYESYAIKTSEGRELSGVLAHQSADELLLRDTSGTEWPLRRKEIQEMRRQSASLMPAGLEGGLAEEEFRDLMAFLQSLK